MSQFRYRPAGSSGWLAVATDGLLLVVHPQAADTGITVFTRGPVESSASGFQSALDELTRGGLSATPSFALLEWSGSGNEIAVRVIVRGGVQVAVTTAGTTHTLDGTGVSTWTEQSFPRATGFDLVVVPADEADEGPWLPIERGTALVTRISSVTGDPGLRDAPAAAVEAPVQPVEEPTAAEVRTTVQPLAAVVIEPPAEVMSEATMTDVPTGHHADARPTDSGYDYLFGETMYRNVSEAAVREPEPASEDEAAAEPPAGDHDGMTIMTGDLKKLRGTRKAKAAAPVAPPASELYLDLSTGSREQLTQPILVGRAPTATKVSGGSLPRLVSIPGDKDISRTHAQFVVEGGTVVVTDLHSRNGTQVIMPGKAPQQLRQGEPTAVIVGTVVDLGGGVTLTVREES